MSATFPCTTKQSSYRPQFLPSPPRTLKRRRVEYETRVEDEKFHVTGNVVDLGYVDLSAETSAFVSVSPASPPGTPLPTSRPIPLVASSTFSSTFTSQHDTSLGRPPHSKQHFLHPSLQLAILDGEVNDDIPATPEDTPLGYLRWPFSWTPSSFERPEWWIGFCKDRIWGHVVREDEEEVEKFERERERWERCTMRMRMEERKRRSEMELEVNREVERVVNALLMDDKGKNMKMSISSRNKKLKSKRCL